MAAIAAVGATDALLLPLREVEGRIVDVGALAVGAVKVWQQSGFALGDVLLWEQRYWLPLLGWLHDSAFRKQEKRRGVLNAIASVIGGRWYDGPGHSGERQVVHTRTLSTRMMFPWLLYRWHHRGDNKCVDLEAALKGWLSLASRGLQFIPEGSVRITVSTPAPWPLRVDVDGSEPVLHGWDAILQAHPITRARLEQVFRDEAREVRIMPTRRRDALTTVLMQLVALTPQLWRMKPLPGWTGELLGFLFKVVRLGMESSIFYHVLPAAAQFPAVPKTLRGAKKRLRMDDGQMVEWLQRMRVISGSTHTMLMMVQRNRALDRSVSVAKAILHRRLAKEAVNGARIISCMWDPGTHANRQWNVMIIGTCDLPENVAIDCVPKDRMEPQQ